jgi:putative transposase
VVVDTLGLVLAVVVHSAGVQDRDGARAVLGVLAVHKACGLLPRLRLIRADGGYAGRLVQWARAAGGWVLEIVKRCDDVKGFVVLPRRWVVERTFGWLGRYRRLSRDYETLPESSETLIRIAMINLMVHRLAPE